MNKSILILALLVVSMSAIAQERGITRQGEILGVDADSLIQTDIVDEYSSLFILDDESSDIVQNIPSFLEGQEAMVQFISDNHVYPDLA